MQHHEYLNFTAPTATSLQVATVHSTIYPGSTTILFYYGHGQQRRLERSTMIYVSVSGIEIEGKLKRHRTISAFHPTQPRVMHDR